MSHPASLTFLAHHEFRLAWRDWWSMLTAGKPHRIRIVTLALVAFALFMHLVCLLDRRQIRRVEPNADRSTLVAVITGCAVLAWSLMMSQAIGSVTRAFYARSDLDLILSSPVASRGCSRSHRHHGGLTLPDGGAAGRALHQHPGLARRATLVQRRWRGDRGRRLGRGTGGRTDGCAVPHHRPEADAARGADRRRHRRRHLRDRIADRRDSLLRHAVEFRIPEVRPAGVAGAGDRERGVVAARGAGRHDRARCRVERRHPAPQPSRCSRRASATTPSPRPAYPTGRDAAALAERLPPGRPRALRRKE